MQAEIRSIHHKAVAQCMPSVTEWVAADTLTLVTRQSSPPSGTVADEGADAGAIVLASQVDCNNLFYCTNHTWGLDDAGVVTVVPCCCSVDGDVRLSTIL